MNMQLKTIKEAIPSILTGLIVGISTKFLFKDEYLSFGIIFFFTIVVYFIVKGAILLIDFILKHIKKEITVYILSIIVVVATELLIKYLFTGHIDLWSIISSFIGGLIVVGIVGGLNYRKKRKSKEKVK